MNISENFLVLIEKYLAGTATDEEKKQVTNWYRSHPDEEAEIFSVENDSEQQIKRRIKDRLFQTIQSRKKQSTKSVYFGWWKQVAAAAIFVLVSSAIYLVFFSVAGKENLMAASKKNEQVPTGELMPGRNKAMLTLADGSKIALDSAANGLLTSQGKIKVQKLSNGKIVYAVNGELLSENDPAFYNTIATPRGGEYQLTLSDGTKVWLNAASSIRFPVVFTGKERIVSITGEAYFEVEKNATMPFKVQANTAEVEVLGTHFNVNAYDDESAIKTTLLEGKVKLNPSDKKQPRQNVLLLPGQQASLNRGGNFKVMNDADVEEAVAWKNGRFQFKSADLQTILRQISRWYDVDIVYKENVNLHFTGQLGRDQNASGVFEKLALTGEVHFAIDGKKVIVSP